MSQRFDGTPHDFFGMAAAVDQAERGHQLAADELNRAFAAPACMDTTLVKLIFDPGRALGEVSW